MKIDRLMSIIMVLLNCDKISANKLAEKFEVTPRTIYRDVDTIAMAGIPVVAFPGVNGGISIMPEYKVDKKFFSASEISTLLMGLSSISKTLPNKDVVSTLEKVKSLRPRDQLREIELQASQIRIDITTWMGRSQFKPNLYLVKQALEANTYVVFDYCDSTAKKTRRCVEPYQLILKEGKWYVYSYCMLREDFRVFKLARISNPEILDDTFEPREFPLKELDGTGWIDTRLITIKLKVHNSLMEQMLELCGEENITTCDKDHVFVDMPFTDNEYGYQVLLGFGDKCECIEPKYVRNELIRRIKQLLSLYELKK